MKLKEIKQINLKGGDRKIMKAKIKQERGITLIALVITIVVLLILAGVSINAIFSDNGIINRAKDAQNKMDQATQNDLDSINELNEWIENQTNGTTGGDDNATVKISTLVGKSAVTKNTKAEDAYGNKITIPKGFKVLAHGTEDGSATYTYSGDNIPAVQDGIVIEDTQTETAGNQFVWVPVGTIKNKSDDSKGATSTITLGRYQFDYDTGELVSTIPVQKAEDYEAETPITSGSSSWEHKELTTFREGNSAEDSTAENATARNLPKFISTSLANGGYYIARFEASGTESKIYSKYNQTVLTNITQPNAATAAREMYGDTTEYASDLVNSYAWDTAIIFIQTYGTGTDASTYASTNKSTSFAKTGINPDKYCNIFDMSGNAFEWTTEYTTYSVNSSFYPCVPRGGYCNAASGKAINYTFLRDGSSTTDSLSNGSLRSILYVK